MDLLHPQGRDLSPSTAAANSNATGPTSTTSSPASSPPSTRSSPGEILNLGCGNPVENLRFVEILEELLGKKAIKKNTPTPSSEPIVTYADISETTTKLGWRPKVQVEQGLEQFIKWMRDEKLI